MAMKSLHFGDTIAAIATPPGEGGIALIRLSGQEAREIAIKVFRSRKSENLLDLPGYSARFGSLCDPITGEAFDEGLLTLFVAPRSYTGENAAELSCHGGRAATSCALHAVLAAGARLAEPGEFTQRAFLNGKLDLAQAEAVADLIHARTETSRKVAQLQLSGSLSEALNVLREELIGILAAIEVTIDFSEEVGDLDYSLLLNRLKKVQVSVHNLLLTADRGRILREGLRVAIIGRPNVGKSSLLNALLQADRAIVTEIAGTTRDTLEETANLGGVPITLVDTAGLRETEDRIEKMGVDRAKATIETADVTLFVLSAVEGITEKDQEILINLSIESKSRFVIAVNKCDAIPEMATILNDASALISDIQVVSVSALTRSGLDALEHALLSTTFAQDKGSSSDDVTVTNVRHKTALEEAQRDLLHALETTSANLPGDFIAIDVRGALDAIGQITGETAPEEIIHRIFKDFCVGK